VCLLSFLLIILTNSSKRVGLHKAFHQIEDAIRKSKADPSANANADIVDQLQELLHKAQDRARTVSSGSRTDHVISPSDGSGDVQSDDQLALDDAENPLQLLARASDLRLGHPQTPNQPPTPFGAPFGSDSEAQSDVNRFFLPMKANPDLGPHLDPVDLGLVTMEEAELLIN
jgi:hypothetical protein